MRKTGTHTPSEFECPKKLNSECMSKMQLKSATSITSHFSQRLYKYVTLNYYFVIFKL